MKIAAILQMFNEHSMVFADGKSNLQRYIDSVAKYCDILVVYDDASTDNSKKLVQGVAQALHSSGNNYQLKKIHLIEGEKNDFKAEVEHKSKLLEAARELGADWVFRIDADEVIEKRGEDGRIRELCSYGDDNGIDSFAFKNANLWRHPGFYRLDNSFNDFVSCRLWKVSENLCYNDTKRGLHQRAVPDGLEKEEWADIITLHYGFASDESILHKYFMYKGHGQSGWELERLIDERTLRYSSSTPEWFENPVNKIDPNDVFNIPLVQLAEAKV
jgi:hypothetical protein